MFVEVITDGKVFEGVDLKEIARVMKAQDFSCPPTIRAYMETVAQRVKVLTGHEVRTNEKVRTFMNDLEQLGLIKIHEGA